MSSGPVGAATVLTIVAAFACVTRSGMPAYALRAKKVSSPAASRPPSATLRVSPSLTAGARRGGPPPARRAARGALDDRERAASRRRHGGRAGGALQVGQRRREVLLRA